MTIKSQIQKFAACLLLSTTVFSQSVLADTLKVGTMSGPESEVMEVAAKVAKEKFDLTIEIIQFDDYITPNVALADGSIDANAIQSGPYLQSVVKDQGYPLVAVANTFVYPIGAYSKKYKHIEELPDQAKIAVLITAVDQARSLMLLEKAGLIKLKDPNSIESTLLDITENPHNFQFTEIEAAQMIRTLDEVDLAVINTTFAAPAGLIATRDALLVESKESPFMNIIATREDNKEDANVKKLIQAYQSDEVKKISEELFKGASIAGW